MFAILRAVKRIGIQTLCAAFSISMRLSSPTTRSLIPFGEREAGECGLRMAGKLLLEVEVYGKFPDEILRADETYSLPPLLPGEFGGVTSGNEVLDVCREPLGLFGADTSGSEHLETTFSALALALLHAQ